MFALSNLDYIQFTSDEASVIAAMMPEQSQVVNWDDRSILIYIGANPINVGGNLYPDVYATDVSDSPQLAAMIQPGYTAPPQSALDALPQAVTDTIASEASQAGALLNSAGKAVATAATNILAAAGGAIGAGLQPVASSLTVPLVIIGVALALMYLPKRR